MSGTTTTTTPPPTPSEPMWAKPSIGIYALTLFAACLIVAYYSKNETAQNLLIGAVISMATTVSGYYYGSSSGSERKTALLNAQPQTLQPQTPSVIQTETVSTSTATPVATPAPTPRPTPAPTPGPLTP